MIAALVRAFAALAQPQLRRVVGLSLGVAVAVFAALWLGIAWALHGHSAFAWAPLDWLVNLLGMLAVLLLTWVLFPAVATLAAAFFLDRVATAVEASDYPAKPPPRIRPMREAFTATARLMGLTILLNLLALPLYVLMPALNIFVFLGLNGYLLGREYFEVVALRRLDTMAAREMRRRFAGRLFLGGVTIAGLFAVPVLNLVAPVVATAFMVHLFEGLSGRTAAALPS